MEELLHYLWKYRIFPLNDLFTACNRSLQVIDSGIQNRDAGPDFFNVKIKLDGMVWAGNVEIHQYSSDWYRHGHHRDARYDSVILHVVGRIDREVWRKNGEPVPQFELDCPGYIRQNYDYLRSQDIYPPCRSILRDIPSVAICAWLSRLQIERAEQRSLEVTRRLERCGQSWEDTFFVTLARSFGFGVNGSAFERWAEKLPLRAVDKHRDNLVQVEAVFFGLAGLLEEENNDPYYLLLQQEYRYLTHKFGLKGIGEYDWKFARLRPGNFPHVRIAQLAWFYHICGRILSKVLETESLEAVKELFRGGTSPYWDDHYSFRGCSPPKKKRIGNNSGNLLVINCVIPLLYAYGKYRSDEVLMERATRYMEELGAENNHIVREWQQAGLKINTAAESQAVIHLKRVYCDHKKCLYCRFGYVYLKRK